MAAALAAPGVVVAESSSFFWKRRSLNEISCSDFARLLNTPFLIQSASGRPIKVSLAEVKVRREKPLKAGRRPPPDAANEKFSLIFSGCKGEQLAQNTYRCEHQSLGRFDLFLVPILTRNPGKIDYQAVVNRPRNHAFQTNT
jgi:hypothetical protein